MAYSEVVRLQDSALGGNLTAGVKLFTAFPRPATVYGFGVICRTAPASVTTYATLQLRRNGVAQASVTLTAAKATAGAITEVSALQRSPTAPDAEIAGFDVNPGDTVDINVSTAEAATTLGNYIVYLLYAPKGSA